MAGSLNKVELIGNLAKDPEIRATQDGREIANFLVATSESWTDKNSGEKKEKAEFHRVAVFTPGLVGVIKKYLSKGSKVFIEGQLQTRKWQDRDGADKYTTEIVLQGFGGKLILLSKKPSAAGEDSGDYANESGGSEPDEINDSIPY